jgi:hypothetical protein
MNWCNINLYCCLQVEIYNFKKKAQYYNSLLVDGGNILLRINWIHANLWREALLAAGLKVENNLLIMSHPAKYTASRKNSWHQRVRANHTWIVGWRGSSQDRYWNKTDSGWLPDNKYPPGASQISEVPFPSTTQRLLNRARRPFRIQVRLSFHIIY